MKIHGYKIKLTAFLPAEPFNVDDLTAAQHKFAALRDWLDENWFHDVEFSAAPGSKIARIPDEPKAAEAVTIAGNGPVTSTSYRADGLPEGTTVTPTMPPVPTALRRT